MSPDLQENKALVRTYYHELSNLKHYEQAERLVSSDFVDHADLAGRIRGVEGVVRWLRYMHAAFPDLKVEIADIIAEGDRVVSRNIWTGSHLGSFLGIEGTGRSVSFSGIVIWRVHEHKLCERWPVIDRFSLVQKLGR